MFVGENVIRCIMGIRGIVIPTGIVVLCHHDWIIYGRTSWWMAPRLKAKRSVQSSVTLHITTRVQCLHVFLCLVLYRENWLSCFDSVISVAMNRRKIEQTTHISCRPELESVRWHKIIISLSIAMHKWKTYSRHWDMWLKGFRAGTVLFLPGVCIHENKWLIILWRDRLVHHPAYHAICPL